MRDQQDARRRVSKARPASGLDGLCKDRPWHRSHPHRLAPLLFDLCSRPTNVVGIHSCGFKDLMLKPELVRAVVDLGFEHPSDVQQECIPQAMLGMDVICQAKSGMGKTAVFVLSTLHQCASVSAGPIRVLVLCHARELAHQICNEFRRFSRYLPSVKAVAVFGGVPANEQKCTLKSERPQVVVGTPGRMLQLIRDKDLLTKDVSIFVVDECDKMLGNLDMRRAVQDIFRSTPHEKQTMMFSATLDDEMRGVCRKFMLSPAEVVIDDAKLTLHGLEQHYVRLEEREKNQCLNDLLDAIDFNQVVIFVRSVQRAIQLDKLLRECNFPSVAMHAALKQDERVRLYQSFKDFEHRILVCTDIWGRGIDIERVNIVINYDMPDGPDGYLHRVGRAGRFGTKGLAITLTSSDEDATILEAVQKRFEVSLTPMPATIDTSLYMTA